MLSWVSRGCILSKFYIKPQLRIAYPVEAVGCILSKFYIKPQPMDDKECLRNVVSYRNSTSNHNRYIRPLKRGLLYLIEILHQTTTCNPFYIRWIKLYLIEILHQTTTVTPIYIIPGGLYLIEILHQTTTPLREYPRSFGCILSKFYIKPQLSASHCLQVWGCILSKFYIKPQLVAMPLLLNMVVSYRNSTSNHNNVSGGTERTWVVSYRNSTSNHNLVGKVRIFVVLYLIEILHQTTTEKASSVLASPLYLIEILHQTTTSASAL